MFGCISFEYSCNDTSTVLKREFLTESLNQSDSISHEDHGINFACDWMRVDPREHQGALVQRPQKICSCHPVAR